MSRGSLALLAIALLLFGSKYFVRLYVDHRIEKNEGRTLPEFSLSRIDGGPALTNADLANKIAVLHFSRSRCVNCEHEKSVLRDFEKALDPAKVVLVTVNTDPVMGFPLEETRATVARFGFAHPTVLATKQFLDDFHGATWANVTPITYVVDTRGVVRATLRGEQTIESLRRAVE